jgi:hypothetical protein
MAADIYTKGFTDKVKWQSVCGLINVVDPKRLNDTIRANAETKIRLEEEDVAKKAAKDAIVPLVNPTKAKGRKRRRGLAPPVAPPLSAELLSMPPSVLIYLLWQLLPELRAILMRDVSLWKYAVVQILI